MYKLFSFFVCLFVEVDFSGNSKIKTKVSIRSIDRSARKTKDFLFFPC